MNHAPSDEELKPWYRTDVFTGHLLEREYEIREQISDGIPDVVSAKVKVIARVKSRDHADEICGAHNSRLTSPSPSATPDIVKTLRNTSRELSEYERIQIADALETTPSATDAMRAAVIEECANVAIDTFAETTETAFTAYREASRLIAMNICALSPHPESRTSEEVTDYCNCGTFSGSHCRPKFCQRKPTPQPAGNAKGFAIIRDGMIDPRTIAETERAAIVNGLYTGALQFLRQDMTDEQIYTLWDQYKARENVAVVAVVTYTAQLSTDAMRRALEALVAKIDELTPDINGMFQKAAIHGAMWPADKNWAVELANARAALVLPSTEKEG